MHLSYLHFSCSIFHSFLSSFHSHSHFSLPLSLILPISSLSFSSLPASSIYLIPSTGEPALIIDLREPGHPSVTISVETNKTRPLHLVSGRTYHIMCRDDSRRGQFDHSNLNVWKYAGVAVTKLTSPKFPPSDQAAVYSSTEVDVMVANEWTLVLQKLGVQPAEEGVYSCHGLQGQNVSFDIIESKGLLCISITQRGRGYFKYHREKGVTFYPERKRLLYIIESNIKLIFISLASWVHSNKAKLD